MKKKFVVRRPPPPSPADIFPDSPPAAGGLPVTTPERMELTYPSEAEQTATGFMPQIVEALLSNLSVGMTLADVSNLVLFPPSIVERWYKTNYCNFRHAADNARAKNKRHHITQVTKAGKNWGASAWWLERKYKEEYSKEMTITVNHIIVDNVARAVSEAISEVITDPSIIEQLRLVLRQKLSAIKPDEHLPVPVSC